MLSFFSTHREVLFDTLDNIDNTMETINDEKLGKIFLYGSSLFIFNDIAILIKATITFMSNTGRFD